jgi:6-phosphogluconolactonase
MLFDSCVGIVASSLPSNDRIANSNRKMKRRSFIKNSAIGFVGLNTFGLDRFLKTESKTLVFIASWTKGNPGQGGAGGIRIYHLDEIAGSLIHLSTIHDELNIGNICVSKDRRFLFAVEEVKDFENKPSSGGGVYSYLIDEKSGSLAFINKQPTMGAFPCFLSVDGTGKHLVVANHGSYDSIMKTSENEKGEFEVNRFYDDGSVALFPIGDGGSLMPISYLDVHTGNGTHPFFQRSPHPHTAIFDDSDEYAIVCDKGNDTITVYSIDKAKNKLAVVFTNKTEVGRGPRHAVFHPSGSFLFVMNEAVSSLTSYHFNRETGSINEVNTVPTIPASYMDTNYPADIRIHPNGKFLYGSNRGHDSIATFRIDPSNGKLTFVEHTVLNAKTPREFNITSSGKYMLVGNQDSN